MILKTLQLENIRSYTSNRISFPEGSLMLSGDVGAGKSTILLAVEFALFGLLKGQLSGAALLRHGTDKGAVTLNLEIDNKEIIIKRGVKKNSSSIVQDAGYIMIDGLKQEGTPTELKVKILELLGYPQNLLTKSKLIYRYTVYTPQEEMKQILSDDKEMRLDTLRKVFGVDKYKTITENSQTFLKHIRSQRRLLAEKITILPTKRTERSKKIEELEKIRLKTDDLEPKILEIHSLINDKKEDLSKIETAMTKRQSIMNNLEIKSSRLNDLAQQFQKNSQLLIKTDSELDALTEKMVKIQTDDIVLPEELLGKDEAIIETEILIEEKRLRAAGEETVKLSERLQHIEDSLETMEKDLREKGNLTKDLPQKRGLIQELQDALENKSKLQKDVESLEKDIEDTVRKLTEMETQKRDADRLVRNIGLMKKCPTCFQLVTSAHKDKMKVEGQARADTNRDLIDMLGKKKSDLIEKKEHVKRLLEDVHKKEAEFERVKAEFESLVRTNKEVVEIQKKFSELGLEKIELQKRRSNFDVDDLDERRKRLDEHRALLKKISENNLKLREKVHITDSLTEKKSLKSDLTKENVRIKEKIKELNAEKLRLNQELSEFDEVQNEYETEKTELEKLLLKEKQIEIAKAELKKEAEGINNILKILDDTINELMLAESKAERLSLLQDWLEKHFTGLIENMEKHVMLRAYNEFNDSFTKWFSMLIEDDSISVRLDEEFSPIITQNGYETEVANLSGGEKTSVALAYRLALNKVINDVFGDIRTKDLLILDEPTDGFSSYQLDKIKDVLEELDVKQVLLVSHESKIESFVDNVLRVNKDEHISTVL